MWRNLLRPDVLFTLATAQALSPYVFWRFGVGEFKGQDNLTYIPVTIWLLGWVGFMLGTRLVRLRGPAQPSFRVAPSGRTLQIATVIMIAVICVQIVSLMRMYGGYPAFSYIRQDGAINIGTAVAAQDDSGVGQVGSVYVTTAVLHALVLLLLIRNLERDRRDQALIALALVVLLVAHGINAKRQGFVRGFVFLFCGLSLYAGDPLTALARATKLVRTRATARLLAAALTVLLFLSFGYFAYIRNQGHYKRSSLEELIAYQEFSIVNFETQCAAGGFGPHGPSGLLWLRRIVPWKLMDAAGLGETDMPARYEPWAPAGFYEDLQWSLGLIGTTLFAFLTGLFTMACYRRALVSPFCFIAYCQIAFSLMLAHSFNEFTSLSWIPAPLVLFWALSRLIRRGGEITTVRPCTGVAYESA